MNMEKSTIIFNKQLVGREIGNGFPEVIEEYTYPGRTISANLAHEKGMRKRMGMVWRIGRNDSAIRNRNLPFSYKRCAISISCQSEAMVQKLLVSEEI